MFPNNWNISARGGDLTGFLRHVKNVLFSLEIQIDYKGRIFRIETLWLDHLISLFSKPLQNRQNLILLLLDRHIFINFDFWNVTSQWLGTQFYLVEDDAIQW